MKKLKLLLILSTVFVLLLTSCQNMPTQVAPIPENDLKTLVAGTLTAVAYSVGQTQTQSVPPTETPTATMTVPPPTEVPTNTPTQELVTVTLNGNVNCRNRVRCLVVEQHIPLGLFLRFNEVINLIVFLKQNVHFLCNGGVLADKP